jgi:hypothetical protein
MIGSRRRQPRFDSALTAVEDATRTPTEVIAAVPEGPTETLFLDPLPEDAEAEVAPEPEPEPLPHAGYAIGPQILAGHDEWLYLFPFPEPVDTPEDTPPFGWVDVSMATRKQVEEFLGCDLLSWVGNDAIIRTPGGGTLTAHDGDRIQRDENGLHVQCTRAFRGWETGEFQIADAAIAAGDAT